MARIKCLNCLDFVEDEKVSLILRSEKNKTPSTSPSASGASGGGAVAQSADKIDTLRYVFSLETKQQIGKVLNQLKYRERATCSKCTIVLKKIIEAKAEFRSLTHHKSILQKLIPRPSTVSNNKRPYKNISVGVGPTIDPSKDFNQSTPPQQPQPDPSKTVHDTNSAGRVNNSENNGISDKTLKSVGQIIVEAIKSSLDQKGQTMSGIYNFIGDKYPDFFKTNKEENVIKRVLNTKYFCNVPQPVGKLQPSKGSPSLWKLNPAENILSIGSVAEKPVETNVIFGRSPESLILNPSLKSDPKKTCDVNTSSSLGTCAINKDKETDLEPVKDCSSPEIIILEDKTTKTETWFNMVHGSTKVKHKDSTPGKKKKQKVAEIIPNTQDKNISETPPTKKRKISIEELFGTTPFTGKSSETSIFISSPKKSVRDLNLNTSSSNTTPAKKDKNRPKKSKSDPMKESSISDEIIILEDRTRKTENLSNSTKQQHSSQKDKSHKKKKKQKVKAICDKNTDEIISPTKIVKSEPIPTIDDQTAKLELVELLSKPDKKHRNSTTKVSTLYLKKLSFAFHTYAKKLLVYLSKCDSNDGKNYLKPDVCSTIESMHGIFKNYFLSLDELRLKSLYYQKKNSLFASTSTSSACTEEMLPKTKEIKKLPIDVLAKYFKLLMTTVEYLAQIEYQSFYIVLEIIKLRLARLIIFCTSNNNTCNNNNGDKEPINVRMTDSYFTNICYCLGKLDDDELVGNEKTKGSGKELCLLNEINHHQQVPNPLIKAMAVWDELKQIQLVLPIDYYAMHIDHDYVGVEGFLDKIKKIHGKVNNKSEVSKN